MAPGRHFPCWREAISAVLSLSFAVPPPLLFQCTQEMGRNAARRSRWPANSGIERTPNTRPRKTHVEFFQGPSSNVRLYDPMSDP